MNDGSEAARLRDEGIDRAVAHADQVLPRWADKAYEALCCFLEVTLKTDQFNSEPVIEYAYSIGVPKPPDGRAWGGVFMRAARAGLIVKVGYGPTRNPKHHKDISALWRRA